MKDWIQDHHRENMSHDLLGKAVREAWDAVGSQESQNLIEIMIDRVQTFIDAKSLYWLTASVAENTVPDE